MISNEINVDSCLVRIPIDFVQVNEKSGILDTWSDYNEDTQEIRSKSRKRKILKVPGIGYDFFYSLQDRKENNVSQHFLYLTINSKMTNEKYFDGVTLENVGEIYDEIIAQKVVHFELDKLLHQSLCTDIDFKRDFTLDHESYTDLLQGLKDATRPSKRQKGYKPYSKGIEWNSRKNSTPAQPNVRIYDKTTELKKSENMEFTEAFLTEIDTTNLRRIEFQIKNKKHFDSYQLHDRSLFGVLNLSQEKKLEILRKVLSKVVSTDLLPIEKPLKPLKLTPAQQFMKNCLQAQLNNGVNLNDAMDSMTVGMNSNNADKYRKKLKSLYEIITKEMKAMDPVNEKLSWMTLLQNQKLDFTQL